MPCYSAPPSGSLVWALQLAFGNGSSKTEALVTDSHANVIALLTAQGNLTINGIFYALSGTQLFLIKADKNGTILWVYLAPSCLQFYQVEVDSLDNVYLSSSWYCAGNITVGSTVLNNTGNNTYDVLLDKLTPAGVPAWAVSFGSTENDFQWDLAISPESGRIIMSGFYAYAVSVAPTFHAGWCTIPPSGLSNTGTPFVISLDINNGSVLACRGWSYSRPNRISTDPSGAVYVTGSFPAYLTIDNFVFPQLGYQRMFIVKFTRDLVPVWVVTATSSTNAETDGIVIAYDNMGGIYTAFSVNQGSPPASTIYFGTEAHTGVYSVYARLDANTGQVLWTRGIYSSLLYDTT